MFFSDNFLTDLIVGRERSRSSYFIYLHQHQVDGRKTVSVETDKKTLSLQLEH